MATSPAPARLVVASSATTEATIQQLLGARTKIARRALALLQELQQRTERDRREFTDQAAQQIHAAPADFGAGVFEPLAARLKALDEADAKTTAHVEALRRTGELIQARIEDLKNSPDRELLAQELERERQWLDKQRSERQDESELLTKMIDRIGTDLDEIAAATAASCAAAGSREPGGADDALGASVAEDPLEAAASAPERPAKEGGSRKHRS